MSQDNYLSLVKLAKELSKKITKLEKGKLGTSELNEALENSRDIYERLTILRYKALLEKKEVVAEKVVEPKKKEVKVEEKKVEAIAVNKVEEEAPFAFNFTAEEEEATEISPNQRNLLDEIQEVGGESLNEKYATGVKPDSLADKLKNSKIGDLRKAIALNQKFLFMNDLFAGEKSAYDKTIDKLNSCKSFEDARSYLSSEVEEKFKWEQDTPTVEEFLSLLERKFI